jgi:hypothetical protein
MNLRHLCTTLACASVVVVTAFAEPATQPASLQIVTREEWGSKPQKIDDAKRHVPKLITIHHEGVPWKVGTDNAAKLRNVQSWGQREKNWPDLPYHYIIAPDGIVYEGRDWHYQPESNTKYSLEGVLNIELLGNFEEQRVDARQLDSLVKLIAKLCTDLKLDPATIRGHKDAAPGQTDCPGKDFHRYITNGSIRKWVEESLAGKSPEIKELDPLEGGPTTQISQTVATTQPG